MSKQVEVRFTCPECNHSSNVTLYRSIWIEYPELRDLIFQDKVNVIECQKCHGFIRAPMALLATNSQRHIAVWYEPLHDEMIDEDNAKYEMLHGPGNFYSEAPRVADWDEFKATIEKFESGELVGQAPAAKSMDEMMRLMMQASQPQKPKSLWSRLFKKN